jgi:hypothetical protein
MTNRNLLLAKAFAYPETALDEWPHRFIELFEARPSNSYIQLPSKVNGAQKYGCVRAEGGVARWTASCPTTVCPRSPRPLPILKAPSPRMKVTGNPPAFLPTAEGYAMTIAADCWRRVASTVAA